MPLQPRSTLGKERTWWSTNVGAAEGHVSRLLVHVEGETEESFVNEILATHLTVNFGKSGYTNVAARLLGNARARTHRGGIRSWPAVRRDIISLSGLDEGRFVPFVLMHEFEALLFSDCVRFADAIGRPGVADELQGVREQFGTPEEIDDSPQTAPSKRIRRLVAGYDKPFMGNLAVLEIGLEKIRSECRHFDGWLTRLEQTL